MKRSFSVAAGAVCLVVALWAMARGAEEAAKKVEAVKPSWQRLLQGDDAKKAAEKTKRLAELQEEGKFEEALKVAETLAQLRAKGQGADHWQAVKARSEVEAIRRVQQAKKEEQRSYSRAFGQQREATALAAKGRYREAQPLLEQVRAIRRKVLGEQHPDTATSYNNLADNLHAQGKYQEAEEGHRKALAIYRKVLGEEHPHTAGSYNNLAANLNAQGKFKEAEEGFRKALAIQRKVLGEEHPETARSYNNAAMNLNAQGKYAEAEEGFRQALAICRKLLGEEHLHTAASYNSAAMNQNAQGKYKEAEEGLRKALAIHRKVLGEEHPDTANSYSWVAYNLNTQGKYQEAEEGYRKALAICRKVLGEEHPHTATCYNNVAYNLNSQGKYQEAEKYGLLAAETFAKARLHIAATGLERAAITSERSTLPELAAVLARNGKADDAWQRFEESLARGTWDDLSARLRRP